MSEIFRLYSQYTGTGILMVLFFTTLVVMALNEKNQSTRTIILYGSISISALIFFPPFFYLYDHYVDSYTYWRMWWLIPTGIGFAYVGTQLMQKHRWSGFLLVVIILMLGGEWVYSGSLKEVSVATNYYQLPQEVVDTVDFLDEYEDNRFIYAAFSPELLPYVKQYNINVHMPYGRDMMDPNAMQQSQFFLLMAADTVDFSALEQHCLTELTRYLVVDNRKAFATEPEDYNFVKIATFGNYDVYDYTGRDWVAWFERINNQ